MSTPYRSTESEPPGVGPAEALQVILTVVKLETQQCVQGTGQILSTPGLGVRGIVPLPRLQASGKSLKLSAPGIFLLQGDNHACGSDHAGFF